jgi:hypothetical protein
VAYATLAELKGFVSIPAGDTADDTTLQLALDAAAAQVDQFCDRTFAADAAPTTRFYTVTDTGLLSVDPISTVTGLVVATDDNADGTYETTWTVGTDFRLEPINAAAWGEPWTRLVALGTRWFPRIQWRPGVSVTARFGWPGGTPPAPVKQAALLQAARLWKRKDAPFGVAGSVEFGSEVRLLAKLDPDVESLLRPYRRNWWVL